MKMKIEIKKALTNKYFILICVYDIIIVLLHCYQSISEYNQSTESFLQYRTSSDIQNNPYAPIVSAFTLWIGCDSGNKFAKLFYLLFPLMAVLPYCWSYCNDIKSGQADKSIKNIGKFNYHLSKYIAVFISSGLTFTFPLLLDFMVILLFVPAIFPDSVYDIYYGIFSNNFMADIFYGYPFLYVLIFLFMGFVFCGLFGSLSYSVSTLIKSKVVAIIIPIALIFLVEYIKNNISYNIEFSPLSFLCPAKSYTTNWKIIVFETIVLFLFTFGISVIRFKIHGRKNNKLNNQRYSYEK